MTQSTDQNLATLSPVARKKAILAEKRADALRANLKKRKDQTNARKEDKKE